MHGQPRSYSLQATPCSAFDQGLIRVELRRSAAKDDGGVDPCDPAQCCIATTFTNSSQFSWSAMSGTTAGVGERSPRNIWCARQDLNLRPAGSKLLSTSPEPRGRRIDSGDRVDRNGPNRAILVAYPQPSRNQVNYVATRSPLAPSSLAAR